jgi:hypothetical protein
MKNNEVLEEIEQLDSQGVNWKIERWPDYTILMFNDDDELIPDPVIDSIILEETDFESYYKLRDIIKNSTTLQIWNKINLAASVLNEMLLSTTPESDNIKN